MGLENDCIYNVNERMMLRAHLTSLAIEDLGHITLYSKVSTKLSMNYLQGCSRLMYLKKLVKVATERLQGRVS